LYKRNEAENIGVKLIPGLMNRVNLFNDDFRFGLTHSGEFMQDATPLLDEFESSLKSVLEEVFNPAIPFDQTTEEEVCKYCPYQRMCYR
jgi:hypothetical protein